VNLNVGGRNEVGQSRGVAMRAIWSYDPSECLAVPWLKEGIGHFNARCDDMAAPGASDEIWIRAAAHSTWASGGPRLLWWNDLHMTLSSHSTCRRGRMLGGYRVRILPAAHLSTTTTYRVRVPSLLDRARSANSLGDTRTVTVAGSPTHLASMTNSLGPCAARVSNVVAKRSRTSHRIDQVSAFQSASSLSKLHAQLPSSEILARTGWPFAQGQREGWPTSTWSPTDEA
jgi:hypothetical protein